MTAIKRAVIQSYHSAAHTAAVQVAGSLAVWLDDVAVATDIPPGEVVAGRECTVLLSDADNPRSAVLVAVHGAPPAPPPLPSRIEDADGDTSLDAEASPDADQLRFTVLGTLRYLIDSASPHHQFTGRVQAGERLSVGPRATPQDGELLRAEAYGEFNQSLTLGRFTAVSTTLRGNNRIFKGLAGEPVARVDAGTVGHQMEGLSYLAYSAGGGSGTTFTHMIGAVVFIGSLNLSATISQAVGIRVRKPDFILGSLAITTWTGLEVQGASDSRIQDAYGLRVEEISNNSGFTRLLEVGPATPYLRVVGGAAPGAGQTNLYLNEGGSLRRVQWKDGGSIGAGDKVLVLV